MAICGGRHRAVRGCLIFAVLYVLSGVAMAMTGIVTLIKLPFIFKTGSIIWTGIIVSSMGLVTFTIVICRRIEESRKNAALLFLSVVVLVVCFINLVLFEVTEWKYMFGPLMDPTDSGGIDIGNIYYAHLVCLVSTITGLVSSLVGSVYICFVLINHSEKYLKDIDEMFGDPEMCKHKYITTSPPDFGNPSPSTSKENEQRSGRLSSWTYEGGVVPTDLAHEFSVALSDVSEESEPRVVAHIERQEAFDAGEQLDDAASLRDDAVDINGNSATSKGKTRSAGLCHDETKPGKDLDDVSESECTSLVMISTRL